MGEAMDSGNTNGSHNLKVQRIAGEVKAVELVFVPKAQCDDAGAAPQNDIQLCPKAWNFSAARRGQGPK